MARRASAWPGTSLRGVDVSLAERDGLSGGTSGRSHGLLHSGARYAESNPVGAEECVEENRIPRSIGGACFRDTGGLFVQLAADDPDYFEETRDACELAADADADYVKTATGFSEGGAAVAAVEVMAGYLPVKASGGIGSFEEAVEMLEAGAERIGASSGVEIVEGYDADLL